jgi:antitoxin ParD1/3/4
MSTVEKRTSSLPAEQAAFIDARVASGAFASASEVVRAGLRAQQEREAAVERWLREDVAPTYEPMKADPARARSGDELLARIRERHAARLAFSVEESRVTILRLFYGGRDWEGAFR